AVVECDHDGARRPAAGEQREALAEGDPAQPQLLEAPHLTRKLRGLDVELRIRGAGRRLLDVVIVEYFQALIREHRYFSRLFFRKLAVTRVAQDDAIFSY